MFQQPLSKINPLLIPLTRPTLLSTKGTQQFPSPLPTLAAAVDNSDSNNVKPRQMDGSSSSKTRQKQQQNDTHPSPIQTRIHGVLTSSTRSSTRILFFVLFL
ncbi:hypothetical protein KY289_023288 [Solanum tuberosum]|nr:hypothetical protein KY289_023288 [Solanum tuberosum]